MTDEMLALARENAAKAAFRKGAATEVDREYEDPERAARQLGNTTAAAKGHYIDIPETVPDNRDVLERWARGE